MRGPLNDPQINKEYATYSNYVSKEWEIYSQDRVRWEASLKAADGIKVEKVLDIGCGAGQEMLPFVSEGAIGIGMDVVLDAGHTGRKLFAEKGYADRVQFVRASGSELPFPADHFDLLVCRGALSFMDNHAALKEITRVLKPGGKLLLKYATPNYYWWKFRNGLAQAYLKSSVHAARVLYAGYIYQLTGNQTFNRLTAGGEIYQTEATLLREIEPLGLQITGHLPDSNSQTPSVVITKRSKAFVAAGGAA